MAEVKIRPAVRDDLPRLTEIYNYYVVNTPITFDLEPFAVEERGRWFEEHAGTRRHRMFVAEDNGRVAGYAYAGSFHDRAAYDTSVATSIYCAHDAKGRGIGTMLYRALFDAHQERGHQSPDGRDHAAQRRVGQAASQVWLHRGRRVQRMRPQIRQILGCVWMERPLRLSGE